MTIKFLVIIKFLWCNIQDCTCELSFRMNSITFSKSMQEGCRTSVIESISDVCVHVCMCMCVYARAVYACVCVCARVCT
jgi:hypothetical protein